MAEKPILFSAEMVRAILDGRKTVTRRVVKPQPGGVVEDAYHRPDGKWIWTHLPVGTGVGIGNPFRCPYGAPGDRLWVRETHYRWTGCGSAPPRWIDGPSGDVYDARGYADDPDIEQIKAEMACLTVPSIHMPRWASRITLEVTAVRVERVQEISEEDAIAEGIEYTGVRIQDGKKCCGAVSVVGCFRNLWDSINAKRGYGWAANPFVWVVEFKRVEG